MGCDARGGFDHETGSMPVSWSKRLQKRHALGDKIFVALHNFTGGGVQANDISTLSVDVWTVIRGSLKPPHHTANKEIIMSSTPSDLYYAQAFHHGEREHRSYVVAIGHKQQVEALARTEHARRFGEYGIALYQVELDVPMQERLRLVNYLGSNMGERWIDSQPSSRQAA